jgi:transposase-like protein
MDWETLYCPNPLCRCYGNPTPSGRLVKNGHSHGYPRARCQAYGSSVSLSYATPYYRLEAEPALFDTAVRALAEGNSLRATARIVLLDTDTICTWLDRAAHHCRLVMLYLWHDLHVTVVLPDPTRLTGSPRKWRPRTPAMAARITDGTPFIRGG